MLQGGRWFALEDSKDPFQRAPTLGGECYLGAEPLPDSAGYVGFNGHPPLGVNATSRQRGEAFGDGVIRQGFNGHPPLGVNATQEETAWSRYYGDRVSTGTHPWG